MGGVGEVCYKMHCFVYWCLGIDLKLVIIIIVIISISIISITSTGIFAMLSCLREKHLYIITESPKLDDVPFSHAINHIQIVLLTWYLSQSCIVESRLEQRRFYPSTEEMHPRHPSDRSQQNTRASYPPYDTL